MELQSIVCYNKRTFPGDLYAGKKGPVLHKFSNPMITPPIIGRNLWRQFKDLPIFGAPTCSAKLEEYQNKLIREFSCPDLDDTEFNEIQSYCK